MVRNEKMVIYSHLSRSRGLVPREGEDGVTVKTLSEYITEDHDLGHAGLA